jgi:hypothetical protein
MRVKTHKVIPTSNLELEDKRKLRNLTRNIILGELQQPTV